MTDTSPAPAPAPAVDLDAYFARIGWSAPVRHDLATLTGLLQAHMARIPFENLNVLLGRRIRLDLASVQDKLVAQRRGGYCFEHVSLFAAVLEALGFAPVRHLARVTLHLPREQAARTHMFLSVPLQEGPAPGRYVVDPGFGAQAARRPLPLRSGEAVQVDDDVHRLVHEPGTGNWVLQAQIGSDTDAAAERFHAAWVTPLEPEVAVDFELGNHFTATHPASPFVNHLMLRALTPDGRVTVMDRAVTLRRRGQPAERRTLQSRDELQALLAQYFGIDLPEVLQLRVPSIPEWR